MDISAKTTILEKPYVSSTGGETYKYESNLVGGKAKKTRKTRKNKKSKKTGKTKKNCNWFGWFSNK
jgi:hypothetical protein